MYTVTTILRSWTAKQNIRHGAKFVVPYKRAQEGTAIGEKGVLMTSHFSKEGSESRMKGVFVRNGVAHF